MERIATIERNTGETQIKLTLNLDGTGKCEVENPIGFFNHMLTSFCKHGLFDLSGKLIGINTWKLIDSSDNIEGMNFSISVDKVKSLFSSYLQ